MRQQIKFLLYERLITSQGIHKPGFRDAIEKIQTVQVR